MTSKVTPNIKSVQREDQKFVFIITKLLKYKIMKLKILTNRYIMQIVKKMLKYVNVCNNLWKNVYKKVNKRDKKCPKYQRELEMFKVYYVKNNQK